MSNAKVISTPDKLVFTIPFSLSLVIFFLTGFYIRFQVVLNDFWGVLYYAKHLSIFEPVSLYNGFFPIGYAFLLRFIPYPYVIYFAFAINIVSAALFLGWLSSLFFLLRNSVWGAALVFLATIIYPFIFQYANTISPDIGAAALSLGGVYFLCKQEFQRDRPDHQTLDDILCGVLFGFSALFRSHGIISAAAALLAYAVVMGVYKLWKRKAILISLALIYLIQISANLLSGHGALETGQNFTAYITFYGMDWWHIPPAVYTFSVVEQFLKDPLGFVGLWIPLFLRLVVYGLPSLLCVFILQEPLERKFAWFVLLATMAYSAPVAIGTSATDRGPFPILGLAIICIGLLCIELWSRIQKIPGFTKLLRSLAIAILVSAVLWISSGWISDNWDFLTLNRGQSVNLQLIESKLVAKGLKKPSEVFTNKFGLYLPGLPPFRPYSNGGWEDYSLWGYRQEFPELPTDSWEAFINACAKNKIKFLALSPGAESVAGFLSALYNGDFHPVGVELITNVGKVKIFQIKN